jgi:hypothetical protein
MPDVVDDDAHGPDVFEPDDFEWHDGNLLDLQLTGLAGERQDLRLTIEIYVERHPQAPRKRYVCVGSPLKRFLVSGDVARITRASGHGNINFARRDYTDDTEILTILLFGGMVEAEASSFEFTEADS